MKLSTVDQIWMAGFFDGEGWVSIVKTKKPLRYWLNVGIANTEFYGAEDGGAFLRKLEPETLNTDVDE